MESNTKGWVIINNNHPNRPEPFIVNNTFSPTRTKAIAKFIKGSNTQWRYWYRKFNFRCVRAEMNIFLIATTPNNK